MKGMEEEGSEGDERVEERREDRGATPVEKSWLRP